MSTEEVARLILSRRRLSLFTLVCLLLLRSNHKSFSGLINKGVAPRNHSEVNLSTSDLFTRHSTPCVSGEDSTYPSDQWDVFIAPRPQDLISACLSPPPACIFKADFEMI